MNVVNLKNDRYTVYIGRGSIFGNPFKLSSTCSRDESIAQYREYAIKNDKLMKAIYGLPNDAILGCYCKPLACHGDVIIKLYKQKNPSIITLEGQDFKIDENGFVIEGRYTGQCICEVEATLLGK